MSVDSSDLEPKGRPKGNGNILEHRRDVVILDDGNIKSHGIPNGILFSLADCLLPTLETAYSVQRSADRREKRLR
ncbi:MAG: hypothetical protein WC644_00340 [Ignavibacteria bacterium]